MKFKYLILITILISTKIYGQQNLIGDTIDFDADTNSITYTSNLPGLDGYENIESGYDQESIPSQIFIYRKGNKHQIVVTEIIVDVDQILNLVIGQMKVELNENQIVAFHICGYNNVSNSNIIAIMEKKEGTTIYNKAIKAWEIERKKRKVIDANPELVGCTFDSTDFDDNKYFEIKYE